MSAASAWLPCLYQSGLRAPASVISAATHSNHLICDNTFYICRPSSPPREALLAVQLQDRPCSFVGVLGVDRNTSLAFLRFSKLLGLTGLIEVFSELREPLGVGHFCGRRATTLLEASRSLLRFLWAARGGGGVPRRCFCRRRSPSPAEASSPRGGAIGPQQPQRSQRWSAALLLALHGQS